MGRPTIGDRAMTDAERQRRHRALKKKTTKAKRNTKPKQSRT
jgi:hypothetical protein